MRASLPPLHRAVALLGAGIVGLGLLLGWRTRADAAEVDARVHRLATHADPLEAGDPLRQAQILLLREARHRRLRNTSLLVIAIGLAMVVGAGLLARLHEEISVWTSMSEPSDDTDPPALRKDPP